MSVQFNQYAGFGYFFNHKAAIKALEDKYDEDTIEQLFDQYHDSAFKTTIVAVDGVSMIVDGMGGKYIFFGKIYQKSEVYQPLNIVFVEEVADSEIQKIKDEAIKIFGTDFSETPQHVLFSHYR